MKHFCYKLQTSLLLSLFLIFSLSISDIKNTFFTGLDASDEVELKNVLSKKLSDKEYYQKEVTKIEGLLFNIESKLRKELKKENSRKSIIQEKELSISQLKKSYHELSSKLGPLHPDMKKLEVEIEQAAIELEKMSADNKQTGFFAKLYSEDKIVQAKLLQNLDYYKEKLRISSEEVLKLDKNLVELQGRG